jgi:hypothetical protein
VRVTRTAYRAAPARPIEHAETTSQTRSVRKAAGNLYPADAVLNLPVGKHSAGLARLVAVEVARGSFGDAQAAVERASGVRIGKRQVEDLARAAAVDTDAFYAARPARPCPERVLGLQADGKGIVMLPGSLRPATAAQVAKTSPTLATRLSPGHKHGRKRMAEIVAVYDLEPVPRTTEDIIAAPSTRRTRRPTTRTGPNVTGTWLAASIPDDIPAVIKSLFDEAERRDPAHERSWVALVDGNRQQIDAIRDHATTRGVTVTIVIDFIPVLEYLWKAAWTFFYPGDPDAETWVADHARTILNGRAIDAAATIRHHADTAGFRGNERKGADDALTYLTHKAHLPGLRHRLGQRLADRHRNHRRRGTVPDQGPDGHHRRPLDHPRRRSPPTPTRRHRQRRLRRVLAMASTAGTTPQPPQPLPKPRSHGLTHVTTEEPHPYLMSNERSWKPWPSRRVRSIAWCSEPGCCC